MIATMLHLYQHKNKLMREHEANSVKENMAEDKIDKRSVYNMLNQIDKDTDLYPYVKQHKSKSNDKGLFYAIHSRWLGPNQVNVTASKAGAALQTSMYNEEKRNGTGKSKYPIKISTILSLRT